jgi:hypothetical protein
MNEIKTEKKDKKQKIRYTTNLYMDIDVKEKLESISKELNRSKNNTITFLINNFYENEKLQKIDRKKILDSIHTVKGLKIKTEFNREDIYNDNRI